MELKDIISKRRKELKLTLLDIAKACEVSEATVSRWESGEIGDMKRSKIAALAKILQLSPSLIVGVEETAEIRLPKAEPVVELNIYDPLSCGTGGFVEDNVVAVITLPLSMIPKNKKDLFGQYAVGDSMIGKNIHDGDLLVFNREQCESGDVGCFCIDENVATCKTLRIVGDQIMLLPANDKYEPIVVNPELFRCVGKLVLVVSRVE